MQYTHAGRSHYQRRGFAQIQRQRQACTRLPRMNLGAMGMESSSSLSLASKSCVWVANTLPIKVSIKAIKPAMAKYSQPRPSSCSGMQIEEEHAAEHDKEADDDIKEQHRKPDGTARAAFALLAAAAE